MLKLNKSNFVTVKAKEKKINKVRAWFKKYVKKLFNFVFNLKFYEGSYSLIGIDKNLLSLLKSTPNKINVVLKTDILIGYDKDVVRDDSLIIRKENDYKKRILPFSFTLFGFVAIVATQIILSGHLVGVLSTILNALFFASEIFLLCLTIYNLFYLYLFSQVGELKDKELQIIKSYKKEIKNEKN